MKHIVSECIDTFKTGHMRQLTFPRYVNKKQV